jgi:hypothetical protein
MRLQSIRAVPISLLLIACLWSKMYAQGDSVLFGPSAALPDLIYLSYQEFRHGKGITRDDIQYEGDKSQLEFFSKVLQYERFSYRKDSFPVIQLTDRVWGYSQNNVLYLNYSGEFYRVPVFGAISYLVAQVTVNVPGFYDPRFGYPVGNGRATELREFLMSFYDGALRDLTISTAMELLKPDPRLHEEYRRLRRSRKKSELYRFIRRYNEAHPVYFLKS